MQLILKNIVDNCSSNDEGVKLFSYLDSAVRNNEEVLLVAHEDSAFSSSFLNSSIGEFLDKYGMSEFSEKIKFKGSKTQFKQISSYITKYRSLARA